MRYPESYDVVWNGQARHYLAINIPPFDSDPEPEPIKPAVNGVADLETCETLVLHALSNRTDALLMDLVRKTGLSEYRVKSAIERLLSQGKVQAVGSRRQGVPGRYARGRG